MDIVVKKNRQWFIVVYTLIDNSILHDSDQNLLRNHSASQTTVDLINGGFSPTALFTPET